MMLTIRVEPSVHAVARRLSPASPFTNYTHLPALLTPQDGRLAEHVLRMHRYVRPGMEGLPVPLDAGARDEERDEDKAG